VGNNLAGCSSAIRRPPGRSGTSPERVPRELGGVGDAPRERIAIALGITEFEPPRRRAEQSDQIPAFQV